MRVLITGAMGFVGTNLVKRLLERGEDVLALDSLSRRGSELNLEYLRTINPDLNFKQKEIEDLPLEVVQYHPDLVYHLAAQVEVTSSVENPVRDFKINAEGTFLIAKAAHSMGVPVIYTSTNKVFGDNVNKISIREKETRYDFDGKFSETGINEEFPIDTAHHTPYGVSKLVGELYVREFGGVANRCSCMYGPHQHGIVGQGWLSHIAQNIINGKPITIYGNGKQVRDALHASDIVNLLELQGRRLLSKGDIKGEVFNVGGGFKNTISLLELCEKWGVEKDKLIFEDWRPSDQKVFYCDTRKAREILGWEPQVGLQKGLEELFQWTKSS